MKNVSAKLLQVVSAITGKVNKSGYNSFQKYKYVTEGDLIDAVRDELVKNGLMITTSVIHSNTSQQAGSDQYMTHVVLKHTIIDVDSGESLDVQSAGSGADKLDKGVYKAITGANKYFLLKTFLMAGDDDPENDGTAKPAQTQSKPAQQQVAKPAGQGFLAKKAEQAAPATKPAEVKTAVKPAFGVGKKKEPVQQAPADEDEIPDAPVETTEEEDAQF